MVTEIIKNKGTLEEFLEETPKTPRALKPVRETKFVILDIETGAGAVNPMLREVVEDEIKKEVESTTYPDNWKPETVERKRAEKLSKLLSGLDKGSALDPFTNRIVIIGMLYKNSATILHELKTTEEEIIKDFTEEIKGRIFITFNGEAFDILTIKVKAAQYGIDLGTITYIDVMQDLKFWNTYLNKYVLFGQDKYAAIFGIQPNSYRKTVNPAEIGAIFEAYKFEKTEENKDAVKSVIAYNKEDLRVLQELYTKLDKAGFKWRIRVS